MKKFLLFSLLCLVGVNAYAQFDQIYRGQNIASPALTTTVPKPGPHSAYCGLRVGIMGTTTISPILTYGVKNNITLVPSLSNAYAVNYCTSNGLYQDSTLKANAMAEAALYFPNVCGKTFIAYNSGTSGKVGNKPFGWSHGGTKQFSWSSRPCVTSPTLSCADPKHSPAFNVGSTSSNNVPVGACYMNTAGACVYNTANPATATGSWSTACPSSVVGTDCCQWKKKVSCNSPSVSVAYPFTQLATNPAHAGLYSECKAAAAASGSPEAYKCCVNIPKDPCEAKGLIHVKGTALNLQGQGVVCCSSKNPREEMLAGKKVCCEVIK